MIEEKITYYAFFLATAVGAGILAYRMFEMIWA
jgi:hypothetical protein